MSCLLAIRKWEKSYCAEEGCAFSSRAQYGEKARFVPTSGNVVLGCLA